LVAARIRLLPPRTLRLRLQESIISSFELLQGGARDAPMRHRTLKDAIAWSYNLLTAAEQRLLRLLSVFVDGCTFEAVERINEIVGQANSGSVLELLTSLVNKSLVQQVVQPDGEIRFYMLEMIREYGLEQSQVNGDFAVATHAHAETYVIFAESAMSTLPGPDQLDWVARLNLEQDNCRAALRWAITHQHAELAMRLAGAFWSFWLDRGYYHEGRQFLVAILQLAGSSGRTPDRARVLTGLGALSRAQGDMNEAHAYLQEAISIYRQWGDEREIATALERLTEGCHLDFALPDYHQLITEAAALYEKLNDRAGATRIRHHLGLKEYREGNYKAAERSLKSLSPFLKSNRMKPEWRMPYSIWAEPCSNNRNLPRPISALPRHCQGRRRVGIKNWQP
jgi:tetratricopeptide (TPR) repeat protein